MTQKKDEYMRGYADGFRDGKATIPSKAETSCCMGLAPEIECPCALENARKWPASPADERRQP